MGALAEFHATLAVRAMDDARERLRLRLVSSPESKPLPVKPAGPCPSDDDLKLLAAVRAGDRRAAAAFYARLRPRLDVTVRRLLGRRDVDHDDLVQLALIEIIRSIDAFEGKSSLETWAFTIAARVAYKHVRARAAHRHAFAAEPSDADRVPADASESDRIIARDLVGRVRMHLDAIEENKAWTFLLHDIAGFDLREVAEITGATVAAAQARLVRGRREIHERIAADPELASAMADLEERT